MITDKRRLWHPTQHQIWGNLIALKGEQITCKNGHHLATVKEHIYKWSNKIEFTEIRSNHFPNGECPQCSEAMHSYLPGMDMYVFYVSGFKVAFAYQAIMEGQA